MVVDISKMESYESPISAFSNLSIICLSIGTLLAVFFFVCFLHTLLFTPSYLSDLFDKEDSKRGDGHVCFANFFDFPRIRDCLPDERRRDLCLTTGYNAQAP